MSLPCISKYWKKKGDCVKW